MTAKGVEDTAFYRYMRLLALNEVGGDPARFGMSVEEFHAANAVRAAALPARPARHPDARHEALAATCARGSARSPAMPARVARARAALARAQRAAARAAARPTANEEYLIYQTLVGAWPIAAERLEAYLEKALREAKRNTSWVDAGPRLGGARCKALRDRPARPRAVPRRLRAASPRGSRRRGAAARSASCCSSSPRPGVADVYQGDELEALSLVDPDNRRPVDWDPRRAALGARCARGAAPDERR